MDEVEKRVPEVEEWNANAKHALLQTLQEQERIQSKLTDASRHRNNLHIFGIPEGKEGDNKSVSYRSKTFICKYNAASHHLDQNSHHLPPWTL